MDPETLEDLMAAIGIGEARPRRPPPFANRDRFTTRPRRVDPDSSQSVAGQVAAQTPYTPPMPEAQWQAQQRRQYDALQQRPRAVEAYQDPRNQFAEAGGMALEATGLPSIRRSAGAFADGRPQEGVEEGAMGALSLATLGVGGRGARAPRPAPPMRAPMPEGGALRPQFDERVAYRGLNRPYDPADGGAYQTFTSSLDDAREYGSNVMAANLRTGRNLSVNGGGNNFNALSVEQLPADVRARLHPSVGASATTDQIAHAAREAGYDSVTVRNVHDNRWGERPARGAEPRTVDFVFDTQNIRPLDHVPWQPPAPRAAERVRLSDADRALLAELEDFGPMPEAPPSGALRPPTRAPEFDLPHYRPMGEGTRGAGGAGQMQRRNGEWFYDRNGEAVEPVDYYYGQRLAPRSPDGGNGGAPPLEGEVLGPAGREMMAPRREITPAMVTEALRRGLPMMADAAEFEVRNIDAIIGAPDIRQIGGRFELFDKATGETVVRLPEGATFRDADRAVVSIIDLGLANNRAGQAALGAPRSPDGGNGSAGRTRLSAAGQDLARLRETAERSDLRGVVGDRQLRLARGQLAESSDSTWNDGTPMAMYQFPGGALTNVRIAQRGDGVREVNFSARGLRSGEASRADIESAFADALAAIERDAAANPGARYLLEGETPSHSRIYERLLTRANEIDGIVARRSGAGIEITIPDGPRQ